MTASYGGLNLAPLESEPTSRKKEGRVSPAFWAITVSQKSAFACRIASAGNDVVLE